MLSKNWLQQIYHIHPRTRFIYVMRDPLARLWSAARMHAVAKAEGSFDAALIQVKRYTKNFDAPAHRRNDYLFTLNNLAEVVDPNHVFIAFFEDLVAWSEKSQHPTRALELFGLRSAVRSLAAAEQ